METYNNIKTYYAKSPADWRKWLAKNHLAEQSVWLIIYKKDTGIPSLTYSEAVDEALCYGWIDSKPNKRDEQSFYQFFSRRKPKSNWSKINKDKVAHLLKEGKMAAAGLEMVELAKKTGTWSALDKVDNLEMPADLKKMFGRNKTALTFWEKFPPSTRRGILEWIQNAKKPETRQKRIEETVALAEKNVRANQYNPPKQKP